MYKFGLMVGLLALCLNIAFADQADQVITLKDGSQIKGQLSGISNGVYTIKTPVIGDVHVAATDVASITNGNVPAPAPLTQPQTPAATSNLDQQIAAQQQKLLSNPQAVAMMQEMAQDPAVLQALQDPTLVQAVMSHDYQAVAGNPKVQELINNPKMQELLKELAAGQQQNAASSQ